MQVTDRYPLTLLLIFIALWTALAIAPSYRQDWLLENLLVFLLLPWLVSGYRKRRFSNAAYTCFLVFLAAHSIGAHYTYSEVPYDRWFMQITGHSINAWLHTSRNHYDRFAHLLYGLLISVPARELIGKRAQPRGLWTFLLPWTFMLSHSVIYELVEWQAAMLFGGPLGQAYLGTQGDIWDAQKDMAMAAMGATTTLAFLALQSHFGKGARESKCGPIL
jgi:putative membrane protein